MSPGSFTLRSMQLKGVAALRFGASLMSASVAEAPKRHTGRLRRARMLSRVFSLDVLTNYDAIPQMRFSERYIRILASLVPWRETTILGQVRTSRRRYCASKEEPLCVLISRLAMPSRVEDLE
jgi:hypothetical protein